MFDASFYDYYFLLLSVKVLVMLKNLNWHILNFMLCQNKTFILFEKRPKMQYKTKFFVVIYVFCRKNFPKEKQFQLTKTFNNCLWKSKPMNVLFWKTLGSMKTKFYIRWKQKQSSIGDAELIWYKIHYHKTILTIAARYFAYIQS